MFEQEDNQILYQAGKRKGLNIGSYAKVGAKS